MELETAIIKTLAWFDLFDMPLTRAECFRFLYRAPQTDCSVFLSALDKVISAGKVEEKFAFVFLPGRENLINTRQERTKFNDFKIKRAQRAARLLRLIPFLRAVFLCNNVGMETADEDSDIDVFIIVKDGRIWLARFFATLILSLFGLRRTRKKITNQVCLSFYLSDKFLNLRSLRIADPDIYLIYWLANLTPIYDPDNLEQKMFAANAWVKDYLKNYGLDARRFESALTPDSWASKKFKQALTAMWQGQYGNILESQAREVQKTKMKFNAKSLAKQPDSRVVINDQMLKFHENDRRAEYQKKWEEKISQLKF